MKLDKFNNIVKYIAEQIKGTDFENHVFVVGGCVRDFVMNNEIKDIDIAVDIPDGGLKLGNMFAEMNLLAHKLVEFPAYSVCKFTLKAFPNVDLEAVQTRKEKYTDSSSRNPVTAFGTIVEDCYRRDLTINTLYMNVSTGKILDITGKGLNDIKNQFISTPLNPCETFDDDPLRMLRVIRFMCRFNFRLDYNTFDGIKEKKLRLNIISVERIKDEFCKMMSDRSAGLACMYLDYTGLLKVLFDNIDFSELSLNYVFHGMCKLHRFGYMCKITFMLLCCTKNSENTALSFLKTLKFSNDEIKYIMSIYTTVTRFRNNAKYHHYEKHDLYKECYLCKSYDFLEECIEVCKCFNEYDDFNYCNILQNLAIDVLFERGCVNFFDFKLPMNGDEIMKEFSLAPGKEIKIVQEWMLEWVFRHPLFKKEDMIKYIHDCL